MENDNLSIMLVNPNQLINKQHYNNKSKYSKNVVIKNLQDECHHSLQSFDLFTLNDAHYLSTS